MSCTPAFIRANTFVGSRYYNSTTGSGGAVATLNKIVQDYNDGRNPSCVGITRAAANGNILYEYLGNVLLDPTDGPIPFNRQLIDTCNNLGSTTTTQFNRIKEIQSGDDQSLQKLQQDEKEARLRLELLRSSQSTVTNHQVFLLGRPLRPASIPLLWALSVLFIGIAGLIFYTFSPFEIIPSNYIVFQIYLLLINPYFIASALLVAATAIIVTTLHMTGTI